MSNQVKGQINEEVINTLIQLSRGIIGDKAVDSVLRTMKESGEELSGKDIVFAFADKIQSLFGDKGSYATIRQLGREVAKELIKNHEKDQWEGLLESGLNTFGFAYKIERTRQDAYICNCVFYEILNKQGLKPIEHCVCWAGWGFIEGFIRVLEEDVKSIKWVDRNIKEEKCKFIFVKEL